jgi:large subunit ribosomal protein L33
MSPICLYLSKNDYTRKIIDNIAQIINNSMASKSTKRKTIVYMIPEGETRDSHTYHYTAIKTRKFVLENKKMRFKKFNPAKQKHEWFVEAKLPPHSK